MAKKEQNRRKKNAAERKWDQEDVLEVHTKFYEAASKFYDEVSDYNGNYGEIGVMYYDQMRKEFDHAHWIVQRSKEDYVAEDLEGCWETTTHAHIYRDRNAGGSI